MVLFVFIDSLLFNLNKELNYALFRKSVNELLFGLSYIIPLNVFGFIMKTQAKFLWEKIVAGVFLWFTLSALADELFFDPFQVGTLEHITGLIILIIIYYYERFKKIRD